MPNTSDITLCQMLCSLHIAYIFRGISHIDDRPACLAVSKLLNAKERSFASSRETIHYYGFCTKKSTVSLNVLYSHLDISHYRFHISFLHSKYPDFPPPTWRTNVERNSPVSRICIHYNEHKSKLPELEVFFDFLPNLKSYCEVTWVASIKLN